MISKEELAILQERLVQLSEKGEGFSKQIEERKAEKAQLPALRAKVEELTKSNQRDEENQMHELKEISTELKNIRMELKNPKINPLEKKIPKMQTQLEKLTENAQIIEKSYKEIAEITEKHNEKLKPWTDYIVAATARIDLFKRLLTKAPDASPLFMRINEAESNLERMKAKVQFFKYHAPKSNLDLVDKEELKIKKIEELKKITADIETANEDLKSLLE